MQRARVRTRNRGGGEQKGRPCPVGVSTAAWPEWGGGRACRAHISVALFNGTRKLLSGILIASGSGRRHCCNCLQKYWAWFSPVGRVPTIQSTVLVIPGCHYQTSEDYFQGVLWGGCFQGTPGLKIRNRNLSEYFFRGLVTHTEKYAKVL